MITKEINHIYKWFYFFQLLLKKKWFLNVECLVVYLLDSGVRGKVYKLLSYSYFKTILNLYEIKK